MRCAAHRDRPLHVQSLNRPPALRRDPLSGHEVLATGVVQQEVDTAVTVERGSWSVKDAVEELNWLPNGPIRTQVEWRLDGYERVSYGRAAARPGMAAAPGAAAKVEPTGRPDSPVAA